MSELNIKSMNKSNNSFVLQASDVPANITEYPVTVTATLDNGEKITKTKNVKIKVTPVLSISGVDSFVAKNGEGSSHYSIAYTPTKYNTPVTITSITTSNSSTKVTIGGGGDEFDLSVSDISDDISTTITVSYKLNGVAQAALTKTVNITYKEDSGPFILYNVGESANVDIYKTNLSVPMTKMYYKVVDDYTEGEEYDDSGVEYEVWENTSYSGQKVATVGNGQALLLKAYEKKRWASSSSSYTYFEFSAGKFKAYGKIGALDGYYTKLASYCYFQMFYFCTSLIKAPELPATTLGSYCYAGMFYNCKGLTTLPENLLPATTLVNSCYSSMFSGCTGLTELPENLLPATTLALYCYCGMFTGCTGLTELPENLLPATTLAQYCYFNMFYGCTGLTNVPNLPATTLADNCYNSMFLGCKGLTNVPNLPATTLASNCYSSMFYNCTGLTNVPNLPATTLASGCYNSMFRECTGLTTVPENLLPATTLADNCYNSMFLGCIGLTSIPENLLPATTLADNCYNSMFLGCIGLTSIPENLLPATTLAGICYFNMFYGCKGLTNVPNLPATTLTDNCYCGMFYGCTGLTNVPNLPATTLALYCYSSMFTGCTGLTTLPENLLPATTLVSYCYGDMFQGCTGLTNVPNLPATTLADNCYSSMFRECTGLTTVPENLLPATTSVTGCYRQMFLKCTGLTNVPNLPATTLAGSYCYRAMFSGCTGLTSIPENLLPATTLTDNCYFNMFYGCTGLTNVPNLPATTLALYCYCGMFTGCTGLTTLPENLLPATTLVSYCYGAYDSNYYYGMFQECTGLTSVPKNLLPATTLASNCYSFMFYNCTGLTQAPELPATTLVSNCYYGMFYGCRKLNYIKALFTTTPGSEYTRNWLYSVASSGTFVKNFLAEWDVTGASGIPSGWTVQLNATHVSWDSLEITADDVNGRKTTTVIHYTLIETMLDEDEVQFQRTITGNVVSDAFEQNTSYTDTITRTITYRDTQSGLTATTTITQGVWTDTYYEVDLNSQWQESSKNPDSSLYDCYESFSNCHVANANAIMYITITGYTEFSLYIRSYGESSCDYLVVGNLDATSISRTTSGVKATTYGNSQSGTTISSYTKVTFSGLDGGEHKIPILYGKDGSANSGDDKGYIIIEKNQ